ncbi:MAG: hypothetical protein ACOC32_04880 [Nanoarchaeota archaeon]
MEQNPQQQQGGQNQALGPGQPPAQDANQAKPPQQQSGGMASFLGGTPKPDQQQQGNMEEMGSELKTLTTRIRTLEEKYRNMRSTLQMNEKNVLEDNKKVNAEIKDINQQIFELKKSFNEAKSKMDIIIKELGLTAKKENVAAIEKYLNLWNPVDFVSQREVTSVVRRALLELGIQSKNDVRVAQEVNTDELGEKPKKFDEEGI